MTQEEKQLLLKDLCARIPYGVMVCEDYYEHKRTLPILDCGMFFIIDHIDKVKPYLRPMSSMTEEEIEELKELSSGVIWRKDVLRDIVLDIWYDTDSIDWLNAHHFDYRGLIPMELAIEAPEGMYNTKTE